MVMRNSVVEVEIDGKAHNTWQEYDIDNDFLTAADAFSMKIGLPNGSIAPNIVEGSEVTVKLDGVLILTGYLDKKQHSIGKYHHSFSISGRDKGALLVDCDAEITNFKGLNLKEAVEKIVNPLGINQVEMGAEGNINFDKIDIEVGMNAWEAVKELVNSAGLHLWFNTEGVLMIGEADYTVPPVTKLTLNYSGENNNIEELSIERSSANRYSEITFLGQSHGRTSDSAKHNLKYVYRDESAQFEKKKTIVIGDAENQAALEKQAKNSLSDMQLEALTIQVTVPGHYINDILLWENGQRIHIESDIFGLDDVFFIMGRRFHSSKSRGRITILTLKEDGVWLPDSKGAKRARKRSGKKKKKELVVIDVNPIR